MLSGLHSFTNSFAFDNFVNFHEPAGNAKEEIESKALSNASGQDNNSICASLPSPLPFVASVCVAMVL